LCANPYQHLRDAPGLLGQRIGPGLFFLQRFITPLGSAQNVIALLQKILVTAPLFEAAFLRKKFDIILSYLQLNLLDEFPMAPTLRADKPSRQRQNAEGIPVMIVLDER
jgi:hypothetical protein